MKDVEKHVIHWISQAEEDLITAGILINQKREVQGMFFCHLAVEKTLKAHIIKITRDHPIRIHQLATLAVRANINLRPGDTQFFGILMNYQIEGRYLELYPEPLPNHIALSYLEKSKEIVKWLKQKLSE